METKLCSGDCGLIKPLSEFYMIQPRPYKGKEYELRPTARCKICHNKSTPEKLERYKQNSRKYYQNHKQEQIKRARQWAKDNPNKVKESAKKSRNKPEQKSRHCKYMCDRRKTDTDFRILWNCRRRIRDAVKSQNSIKSQKSLDLMGCTENILKQHFESKF